MLSRSRSVLVLAILSAAAWSAAGQQQPALTPEDMARFLQTAKVIASRPGKKGVTSPPRLTLSNGTITHDASFQAIDESFPTKEFPDGRVEVNFRDSYKYNIAAYELSKLLGLDHMMPVTVLRKWNGKTGSLTWWLPAKMDEQDRVRAKLEPPDPEAWSRQMNRMWVFEELVYDADRNQTNILYGEDWKLYMIDFSRAFRLQPDLRDRTVLARCDRQLLEKLRQLDARELAAKTKGYLNGAEVKAVMQRRDKIVTYFEQLVKEKGEAAVLY